MDTEQSIQQMALGQLDFHMQMNKVGSLFTPYKNKTNLKMTHRPKTMYFA